MTDVSDSPAEHRFRMPAEWEPHAATWIAWPHEKTDWPGKFSTDPLGIWRNRAPPVACGEGLHTRSGSNERTRSAREFSRKAMPI